MLRSNTVQVENLFKIRHKELLGDQINQIIMHPESEKQLFVQSRDNCVRLVQYENAQGPRIKKRLFGAKCKDLMVRCAVSPDGLYLISGSEDGKPYIWDTTDERLEKVKGYQYKLLDLVSDCQWNPRYNMFAVSGFGHNFPVLVYVFKRTQSELLSIINQGKGVQMGTERAKEWAD